MSELIARTGRHQQRYDGNVRLVAGCIPYKYIDSLEGDCAASEKIVEVLMINSTSGPGLLFPKGGWENDETVEEAAKREAWEEAGVRGELMECLPDDYCFKSKTQEESNDEGLCCKAKVFPLLVQEELESWPEWSTRNRNWLTLDNAVENCRHQWMKKALRTFSDWRSGTEKLSPSIHEEDDNLQHQLCSPSSSSFSSSNPTVE